MFLRNSWYAAAWNHEVTRAPMARKFLNEPVVLYRRADGTAVALEDRCCHRALPLSLGRVQGDELECGYHGLRFAADGACVSVPGQTAIPPDARVRAYPLAEKYQWIWIWMGDPERADPALLPDWWWMDHPDWAVVKGNPVFHAKCNYQLITDNLLDLTHVTYVHEGSIGTAAVVDSPIATDRREDSVLMTRWVMDSPAPPTYQTLGKFPGNVDRWQIVETSLPSFSDVFVGCAVAGSGAPEGDFSQGIEIHNANAATPETENTTHYFYAHARRFGQNDPAIDTYYAVDFRAVFQEDIDIFDAQQASLERDTGRALIDINVDAPGLAIRHMLDNRIAAEQRIAGGQ